MTQVQSSGVENGYQSELAAMALLQKVLALRTAGWVMARSMMAVAGERPS
jgi:hypothetical protein